MISTVCIRVIPGLKATKVFWTKGTVKSYLAELLLKLPIPCELCTGAVPSGSREHPQPSRGIGQARSIQSPQAEYPWASPHGQNLLMGAVASQPTKAHFFYTKAHLHTRSPRGWQVPRFIPPAWGSEWSDCDSRHGGHALLLERRVCHQVPAHLFLFVYVDM